MKIHRFCESRPETYADSKMNVYVGLIELLKCRIVLFLLIIDLSKRTKKKATIWMIINYT